MSNLPPTSFIECILQADEDEIDYPDDKCNKDFDDDGEVDREIEIDKML